MKFCSKRKIEYESTSGTTTSSHYITEQDMINFHGLDFVGQWKVLARHLPKQKFGKDEGYYYSDYQHYARDRKSVV